MGLSIALTQQRSGFRSAQFTQMPNFTRAIAGVKHECQRLGPLIRPNPSWVCVYSGIPSHLSRHFPNVRGLEIEGNAIADKLAGKAALAGREENYENPDKGLDSWTVHTSITREAAKLTYAIDKLFPHNDHKDQRKEKSQTKNKHKNGAAQASPVRELAASAVKPRGLARMT